MTKHIERDSLIHGFCAPNKLRHIFAIYSIRSKDRSKLPYPHDDTKFQIERQQS